MLVAASWWDRNSGAITFVALIVAVVAIAIAFAIAWYQREPKTFDWQVIAEQPILAGRPEGDAAKGLEVMWLGQPLMAPYLVTVRLKNTGKKEVRPDDFYGPIAIKVFGSVITAETTDKREGMLQHLPDTLVGPNDATVHLEPILFNAGDWVDVQLLVEHYMTNSHLHPQVEVTIAGQSRPAKLRETDEVTKLIWWNRWVNVFLGFLVVVLIIGVVRSL